MLSKFSVKKPYTIIVAVIIILILGTISFVNLQTDLLPSLDLPILVINTTYPGASPEEVEMVVTKPIEQVVARTSNVKDINSVSSDNSSIVIMEFDNDVNMDSTIIELNGNLDLIEGAWDDSIGSPMIMRVNPDMLPIMMSSVDAEGLNLMEISDLVEKDIIPELESVSGVASVDGTGLIKEEIDVKLDQGKIDDLNKELLNKVDSELAEVGNELDQAKKEIKDGKNQLENEEESQLSKLNQAEGEIQSGKEQLEEGKSGIEEGLSGLQKKRRELMEAKAELEAKEEELLNLKNQFEGFDEVDLSLENLEKLQQAIVGLGEIEKGKEEIEDGILAIDGQISQLRGQKSELEDQLVDLKINKQDLALGKTTLSNEMDKARRELESGEDELDKNIEEFEEKRDEALEGASLEGAIDKETVSNILMAQNFSMPAGYLGETDKLVKVGEELETVEEMENLLLFDTGEDGIGKIYLKDVGEVSYSDNSESIYAKVNGNNAVMLNFQKQSGYSTSIVSNNINEKMNELKGKDASLSFTNLMDQGVYIDIVVKGVLLNILLGGFLAILVLMAFLRDKKPTFIIAVSIPISVVFAVAMMYFTGVTINIISLAGLALGVGMLVDNSIVVIENIYRLRSEGMSKFDAAIEGAREVAGAITASTITTACVFLPIVFTKGISRELFTDMGLTIAYSLFASLLVALTLVPTMSSMMLKQTEQKGSKLFDKFRASYEKILKGALAHRALIMIGTTVLLVLSGYLAYNMGTSFIPEMESPQMNATLEMPEDSSREETLEASDLVIENVTGMEGIEAIGALKDDSMEGLAGPSSEESIDFYILLDEDSSLSNDEITRSIEKKAEDIDGELIINSSSMDMAALGGSGVELVVKGRELTKLSEISTDMKELLEDEEGLENIESGTDDESEEIKVIVNKEKAMEQGLTTAQVFSEIDNLLEEGKEATKLRVENKEYPIIVMEEENLLNNKESLLELEIENNSGEKVVLGDIVEVEEQAGVSSINRELQERKISVTGEVKEGYNIGLVSREVEKSLDSYDVPEDYTIEVAGENEMINESLRDLVLMLLLSIVLIYLIMVAEFQSLLSPFIVMFTIPLAFTGGLLALWITGNNISLIAMLGFLVLAGIVVNNGIVFVDYTNQLRERGKSKEEALVSTGKTRLRPILMTAVTTILGLITLALGVGSGSEMLQPLAIVAIGGLVYATLLTLFVVPVMYDILNKEKEPTRSE